MNTDKTPPPAPTGSLCFFNNKGGVGKTTLACNVASQLASTTKAKTFRILLIDADPQCNATQLILSEEQTRSLYKQGTISVDGVEKKIDTLRDVLSPLVAGEATLGNSFSVVEREWNRFGVDLLPGHPKVALLEDKLSSNWSDFVGGDLGGARVTNWNTQLLQHLQGKYNLIVYDVGPSLGALNRAVLVGADFFVAPMGCDIFSLIGIDNIADWMCEWQEVYKQGLVQCGRNHADKIASYAIKAEKAKPCQFVGYTVQQYITKTIRQERRATEAYEQILKSIPEKVAERLNALVANGLSDSQLALGDVPHMFSLVPLAQTAHAPIDRLTAADGLTGGQFGQQKAYKEFIAKLSNSLRRNLQAAYKNRQVQL